MITLLVLVAYIATAFFVYVRMVPACYRRSLAKQDPAYPELAEEWARESAVMMAGWRAVFWPYGLLHTVIADAVSKAAWRPIEAEKQRVAQLRLDLAAWQERAQDPQATDESRQMASDIAKTLDDMLKQVTHRG